jgi:hypothetical protein
MAAEPPPPRPPQISRRAAASTIPVTNAAKQENSRRSSRIRVMSASPLPVTPQSSRTLQYLDRRVATDCQN